MSSFPEMPVIGDAEAPVAKLLRALDPETHLPLVRILLDALGDADVAICLCDPNDHVRYANGLWHRTFFHPDETGPTEFMDAIGRAILAGGGIRLETISLADFKALIRKRRREGPERLGFYTDLADGSWWWVRDYRLPSGWFLMVATDISSVKREELRLRDAHAHALRESQTDFLTGLPNRRRGMADAATALDQFNQDHLPLTLGLLDLDLFKSINDAFGHDTGDAVLAAFANMLAQHFSLRNHVSRIGGEEFMVVMPETPIERARQGVERLLRDMTPLQRGENLRPLLYSFSAGLAQARPGESLKSLLTRADASLYQAKISGRRRVEISQGAA
ncbi:MAG: GGDEF domain-containing protein [Methylobacterium mesophilicum]|nr:GGDEF domain-containing protein [Methylobacterium mesophilicum]